MTFLESIMGKTETSGKQHSKKSGSHDILIRKPQIQHPSVNYDSQFLLHHEINQESGFELNKCE